MRTVSVPSASATAAGLLATSTFSVLLNSSILDMLLSWTTRPYPSLCRLLACRDPMDPKPMNPTCIKAHQHAFLQHMA